MEFVKFLICVYNFCMILKKNYCLLSVFLIIMCFSVYARSKDRYIAVEEIESKTSPSLWGQAGGIFYYGDKVQVIEIKKTWLKISCDGKTGWVKDSCLTSKKIKADGKVSVDADELALAGKGFSNALEAEYSNIYDIDFDIVDSIEQPKFSSSELKEFIVEGELMGDEL